ncbi:hypothetical protein Syun_009027 [Stephania yunnanensis]|uniref:Uncharacterized protein n=1 Tax=Stephania yunnanensis TaxID=152371 RepID=A0AAP0KDQ6_9MAGN
MIERNNKAGVKGLVEAGITKAPRIFVTPPDRIDDKMSSSGRKDVVEVPIIDLEGIYDMGRDASRRNKEIDKCKAFFLKEKYINGLSKACYEIGD